MSAYTERFAEFYEARVPQPEPPSISVAGYVEDPSGRVVEIRSIGGVMPEFYYGFEGQIVPITPEIIIEKPSAGSITDPSIPVSFNEPIPEPEAMQIGSFLPILLLLGLAALGSR